MDYTVLGQTGMEVSRICLGTMTFGSSEWNEWTVGEERSHDIIERALELGINFFDTSNTYAQGDSERILGAALADEADSCVISTKGYYQQTDDKNVGGLSRKALDHQVAGSLDRLGLDTIDLYQIHRWDYRTPIEVTLRALDDKVRAGEIRHLGASSVWAHQLAEAIFTSRRLGLAEFATLQNHYNLVYREEEREMLPFCAKHDIGVIPWSPLARGFLARPFDELESTARGESDRALHERPYQQGGGREINRRVAAIAEDHGATMAQIGIAWLLAREAVDAPIVGVSSVEHLEQAAEAVELSLSPSDVDYLEEPYEPLPVTGHGHEGEFPPDRFVGED